MTKCIRWVGLDVHADSIAIAEIDDGAKEARTSEIESSPKVVAKRFKRMAAEADLRVCYEAGGCGFELYRQLTSMGIECIVVAPSLVPKKPGDHVKTDRRDAIRLARALRTGELTAVYVPNQEQESARDLLRARDDVRKDRITARHRLSSFLLRRGHRFVEASRWSGKHAAWLKELRFAEATAQTSFEHYRAAVEYLDVRLKALDAQIAALAKSDAWRARVERLSSLRGIATLSAMIVLTELIELRRFENPRKLMSYVGLVPSEHSSGNKQQRGRITKAGNGQVRRILVESAWTYQRRGASTAIKKQWAEQPPDVVRIAHAASVRLSKRYARLAARGKPQKAVVAVARELCGFIWALEQLPLAKLPLAS
ncbi:MAG TPA: IS110 family transposase [Polyangiaceae bacterium]|nr:IS110 family transposase [Polyangiaceae bacterium]